MFYIAKNPVHFGDEARGSCWRNRQSQKQSWLVMIDLLPEGPIVQGVEKSVFVRCSFVRSLFVRGAVIKAIWIFSKFSLILLRKGFGGVTRRPLPDPKFGRFTSDKAYILDQNWIPKMDSFRSARRATCPAGVI